MERKLLKDCSFEELKKIVELGCLDDAISERKNKLNDWNVNDAINVFKEHFDGYQISEYGRGDYIDIYTEDVDDILFCSNIILNGNDNLPIKIVAPSGFKERLEQYKNDLKSYYEDFSKGDECDAFEQYVRDVLLDYFHSIYNQKYDDVDVLSEMIECDIIAIEDVYYDVEENKCYRFHGWEEL